MNDLTDAEGVVARAVIAEDAAALSRFFEADCGSACFCRYWHFPGDKNEWLDRLANHPGDNRRELERALATNAPDGWGVLATRAGAIVGWAKVSPASTLKKAYEQRFYRRLGLYTEDRPDVFVVGCLLVAPDHRHRGIARALVTSAIDFARAHGGRFLEALPRRTSEPVSDGELWTGPASIFDMLGFQAIDTGPEALGPYPVMRLGLTDG